MSKHLGQPVLLIPALGGGGIVGAYKAARSKPDGHTLYLVNAASNCNVFYVKKDVPYSNNDFEFLAGFFGYDLGLFVKPNSPLKTLEDYIEYAKKNPNAIKQATYGIGTSPHIVLELLKIEGGGLKIDMVPFKTVPEFSSALIGGHIDAAFHLGGAGGTADEFRRALDAGAKLLAVASKERLKAYPDVPTFLEKGLKVVYSSWYGLGGPKGMPKEVSQKLKDVIYKVMKDPQTIKSIQDLGGIKYEFRTSEEFTSFIEGFNKLTKRITEEAKIPKE
jgi:tripartite-type tricarboxylate transporter receptor subunit TctC